MSFSAALWLPVAALLLFMLTFAGYKTYKYASGLSGVINGVLSAIQSVASDVKGIASDVADIKSHL